MTPRPSVPSLASASTSSRKSVNSSPLTASTPSSAMSPATAKSSPAPSTSLRAPASPSLNPPSADSLLAPPEPDSAGGPTMVCRCGVKFTQLFPEQKRCSRCRARQLGYDGQRGDADEIDLFNSLHDQWEHFGDWQLHDPDHPGVLIWASDLAKRYRADTKPRPVRNNLGKWQ